jgi:anti-anti-sigma regulatory factor
VDCRIEVVDQRDHRIIRLAGRLTEAQVPALLEACAETALPIRLDLGDLISFDAAGLQALHSLRQDAVELLAVPTYIQLRLDKLSARSAARHR